jgi:hypothetical protein
MGIFKGLSYHYDLVAGRRPLAWRMGQSDCGGCKVLY